MGAVAVPWPVALAYLVAAALFVASLGGLSAQATARRGNVYGMVGMGIAVLATLPLVGNLPVAIGAMVVGGAIGAFLAARVEMTSMPELVAGMHSFVGLAAVLVGLAGYYVHPHGTLDALRVIHLIETFLGVLIGAVTFTGSIVAFGKLRELIGSKPLLLPGRHALNLAGVIALVGLAAWFVVSQSALPLLLCAALAGLLGVHLVMAIGGADMPVVVSVLNSYSGWAAAATGFLLGNDLLITTGALVGSSGAILSYIMCKAMNRSIWSVVLGGFGSAPAAATEASEEAKRLAAKGVQSGTVDDVVDILRSARSIVVVPGYGMAVAQAQHAMRELTELLQKSGATVRYAIHPVAGRLPGHMNVLLAEANVPYNIVLEMDEINQDLSDTDAVFVMGANDIVNPGALDDPNSPIAGMPVLEVWKSRTVVVVKRSLSAGFAGIDNPLFYRDNTMMLFGDARKMAESVVAALKGGGGHHSSR